MPNKEQKTPGPSSVSLIPTRVTNEETSRASTSFSVLPDDGNDNDYDFESGEEEDDLNERENAYRNLCELLEESEVDEDEMNLRLELSESNESDDSDF